MKSNLNTIISKREDISYVFNGRYEKRKKINFYFTSQQQRKGFQMGLKCKLA